LLVEDVSEQEICIAKYNSHDPVAAFSRAREHMKATINRLQLEVSK
jgi:hypothetical protein